MSERVIFWQNSEFNVEYQYRDPGNPETDELPYVQGLHQVTPYGLMLFSLASCTAQVVLGYAGHHNVNLDSVRLDLSYEKNFQDDCDDCLEEKILPETITGTIDFIGKISSDEKQKLLNISKRCPIENILKEGIPIRIKLME
jgi:putative redox protein